MRTCRLALSTSATSRCEAPMDASSRHRVDPMSCRDRERRESGTSQKQAHRLVLSMASDPLFAMLSGSFAEGSCPRLHMKHRGGSKVTHLLDVQGNSRRCPLTTPVRRPRAVPSWFRGETRSRFAFAQRGGAERLPRVPLQRPNAWRFPCCLLPRQVAGSYIGSRIVLQARSASRRCGVSMSTRNKALGSFSRST